MIDDYMKMNLEEFDEWLEVMTYGKDMDIFDKADMRSAYQAGQQYGHDNKKQSCVWCHRELQIFPEPATIPYVAREETRICHSCIKHLMMIVNDQESRMQDKEEKS